MRINFNHSFVEKLIFFGTVQKGPDARLIKNLMRERTQTYVTELNFLFNAADAHFSTVPQGE